MAGMRKICLDDAWWCGRPYGAYAPIWGLIIVRVKMKSRVILNTQRKDLHDILVSAGVDPTVTKWTSDKKGWTSSDVDTLEAGLCHFLFNPGHDGTYTVHFRPGVDGGAPWGELNLQWTEFLNFFAHWATYVKTELQQEDPWQQYSTYLPPERRDGTTDNSPFTHQEAERIANSLSLFREHIRRQLPHYSEVKAQFEPQLERLAAQAKAGSGRVDWSNQFVGMLISLCISLSLAPETASSLWQFWKQAINDLFLP